MRRVIRVLRYAWASPNTLLGLCVVALTLPTGGRASVHTGVIEASGGFAAFALRRLTLLPGGASAMTLGHVVIARDAELLDATRAHERVHVRQYERWGPAFLPAYAVGSLWALALGRHAYRENPFERAAFAVDDPSSPTRPAGRDA